jgi:hypothetical protein
MPVAGSLRADRRARRGERFTAVMTVIVRRLPFDLAAAIRTLLSDWDHSLPGTPG